MAGIKVILLLVLGALLIPDYKRDKGLHTKAKIFHAACLALLTYSYGASFFSLGRFVTNYSRYKQQINYSRGIFSAGDLFTFYTASTLVGCLAFLLIYQLIKRNEKARRQLSYIMPLLVVLETINFYIGWHSTDDAETMSDFAVFSIGFIVIGIIAGGIVYVYNTPFMKEFFASPIDDKINTQIHDNLGE